VICQRCRCEVETAMTYKQRVKRVLLLLKLKHMLDNPTIGKRREYAEARRQKAA
jgi:hypothetical protein